MKPKKKDIRKWCEALRSGEYEQTTGCLNDFTGFCCLGVACDLFMKKEDTKLSSEEFIYGNLPSEQKNCPSWLRQVNTLFSLNTSRSLSSLNDSKELNFDEIADCLEAVFIHEVLD